MKRASERRDTTQFSQEPGKRDLNAALQKQAFWSNRPLGESFQSNTWVESSARGSSETQFRTPPRNFLKRWSFRQQAWKALSVRRSDARPRDLAGGHQCD